MTHSMPLDNTIKSEQSNEVEVDDDSVKDDQDLYETAPSKLPYFGADFDVAGLVRRLDSGDIVIPRFDPDESNGLTIDGFQRQPVWTPSRMDSFIESLLFGWPIPSIFLVVEPDGRYLVLDGQQRLTTLQNFYHGEHADGKPFKLKDVTQEFQGAQYETLDDASQRRLNNTFIQAVVIEPAPDEGKEAVYRLFGRLNSGGVSLTSHEIRVALYRGPLVDLIRDLNNDPNWRMLFGPPHNKLKDHELILRSLAMSSLINQLVDNWANPQQRLASYKPPMSQFLNTYLEAHNKISENDKSNIVKSFQEACQLLYAAHGADALKLSGRINAAHIDALLGTLMYAGRAGITLNTDTLREGIDRLRRNQEYLHLVSRSTSHRDSVIGRLRMAYDNIVNV